MSWNPVLNKFIEIKNEYQNKFGHIEYNYTEGYTDETETCLERWVSELNNPEYADLLSCLELNLILYSPFAKKYIIRIILELFSI